MNFDETWYSIESYDNVDVCEDRLLSEDVDNVGANASFDPEPNGYSPRKLNWVSRNYQCIANIINVATVAAVVMSVAYLGSLLVKKMRPTASYVLGATASFLTIGTFVLRDWTTRFHILNTLYRFGSRPSSDLPPTRRIDNADRQRHFVMV